MAIGEFAKNFDPATREEGKGSTYHRAMGLTRGVLVTPEAQATGLLSECYESGFPVALQLHEFDTPRIETPGVSVVGHEAIRGFLAGHAHASEVDVAGPRSE